MAAIAVALIAAAPEPAPAPSPTTPKPPSTAPAQVGEPAPPAPAPAPEKKPPTPIPVTKMPADKVVAVLGQPVVGPLGTTVGRMVDVLVGKDGLPEAAVIDFGGFLGVGSRKIAVHWNTLHFNPGDAKYPIVLDLMPAQIKAAPSYKGETKPAPVVVAPWEPPPTDNAKPSASD